MIVPTIEVERDLLRNIEEEVRRRIGSRVRRFGVSVVGGQLVLDGSTLTYHAKQLVQHAVMEICPLRIHANHIQVDGQGVPADR